MIHIYITLNRIWITAIYSQQLFLLGYDKKFK